MSSSLSKITSLFSIFKTWLLTSVIVIALFSAFALFIKNRQLKNQIKVLQYNYEQVTKQLNNCVEQSKTLEQNLSRLDYQVNTYISGYKRKTDSLSSCREKLEDLRQQVNYYRRKMNSIRAELQKIYTHTGSAAERKK